VLNGVPSRGAAVPDVELVKNRAEVRMDRAAAEKERLGDLGIRHPPGHQAQHLDLSGCQVFEAGKHRLPICQLGAG
jgi:hypothetical protein